ncbi:MAG: cyclic nucleotide-binding domain-containing protein [Planctomycetaceae bacterium]
MPPAFNPGLLGEFAIAAAALLVFVASAPSGRRRLGWGAGVLFGLAFVPLIVAAFVPTQTKASETILLSTRFFLLASLRHSLVLVAGVSCWERISRPVPMIFLDVIRWSAAVMALVVVLWEAGVRPGELFTGSAILTAILGFALKDTLGNVFAGLAIHAEHPFEVGDWIQYDQNQAHIGRVVEVNWRATKVLTLDEALVIIPNSQLALASIRNFTKPDSWSRRSLFVVTPYEISPQRVQRIILGAIRGSFGVLEQPPPSVVTNAFTERGVEHWVRLFTDDFDKRDRVDGMARDRIWFALARHGIEIPVATQQIRLSHLPAVEPEERESMLARRCESLASVGVLTLLDASQIGRLAEAAERRPYAAGESVIHQGDPGESLYVIEEGSVEVTVVGPSGRQVPVATLNKGDFFGELSLLTGAPRSATVTAIEESILLEIGKESMRGVLQSAPQLAERLGHYLDSREQQRTMAIDASAAVPPQEPYDPLRKILDCFGL